MKASKCWTTTLLFACACALVPAEAGAAPPPFIGPLHTVTTIASTVPGNGDINPYGTAVVPRTTGKLVAGDVLVSNFNNSDNKQGTGTTIVEIAPDGTTSLFAQIDATTLPGSCPGGVGLTTALVVLRSRWVIVGSLPTTDGMSDTAEAGCLIVLNKQGQAVEALSGAPINGPWDMTAADFDDLAVLFVTNVLNDTVAQSPNVVNEGTVVRIVLFVGDDGEQDDMGRDGDGERHDMGGNRGGEPHELIFLRKVIASGFGERTDPAALVIGPTGLGLDHHGTLYVADTLANRIAAIPNALSRFTSAGTGNDVSVGGALNGPLGLALAPNGDILTVNSGDGNIVETTPGGSQVAVETLDSTGSPPGAGALFGLAVVPGKGVYFVDDASNSLNLLN